MSLRRFDNCRLGTEGFDFTDQADATAAAQALLDQVFLDGPAGSFDSNPEMTLGCSHLVSCNIIIPYALNPSRTFEVRSVFTQNAALEANDVIFPTFVSNGFNTSSSTFNTYARFTPAQVEVTTRTHARQIAEMTPM